MSDALDIAAHVALRLKTNKEREPDMIELKKLDAAEKTRTYTFPNNETIVLQGVTHFLARDSGTHRLQTADGKLHIVPVGWLHVEIDASAFSV